jgi:hypothetical protein
MGILRLDEKRGFTVADAVLVKQEVSVAHVDLDMDWWAEKQVELFETGGIQPWQTSAWIHTHPAGVERPSLTDEETMRESFGAWDFAIMIILTKSGRFYARMDFNHTFGPPQTGFQQRFNVPCEVEVLWTEAEEEPISRETLQAWEKELKELVSETVPSWPAPKTARQAPADSRKENSRQEPDILSLYNPEETESEVNGYVQACINSGIEPDAPPARREPLRRGEGPDVFERYFGRKPTQHELKRLEAESGLSYW